MNESLIPASISEIEPRQFSDRSREVLSDVVASMRALITAASPHFARPADFGRQLSIPRKLAWQAVRVGEATDALAAINFMPGPKSLRDLIEACRGKGVKSAILNKAAATFEAFEAFVSEHAGDRKSFVSMLGLAARNPDELADADRVQRRAVYGAFTHFCGVQSKLCFDLTILHSDNEGFDTAVSLNTKLGLRRLREGAPCVMDRFRFVDESSGEPSFEISRPVDEEAYKIYHAPVIPAFCSSPVPQLAVEVEASTGWQRLQWIGSQVGIKNEVTLTTGHIARHLYRLPVDGKPHGFHHMTKVGYPCESMVQYVLICAKGRTLLKPQIRIFLDPLSILSPGDRALASPMHVSEEVESYPVGSWQSLPVDTPMLREQVAYVCARTGWNPFDFAVFKFEIDYPLMNSVICLDIPWE